MNRFLGLLLCLASLWLLYGLGMELFIAWYSGSEPELDLLAWIHVALQAVVNLAAAVLGWRLARGPRSRGA